MQMIETTLCLLRKDNKILLPRKKRGVGAGKFREKRLKHILILTKNGIF